MEKNNLSYLGTFVSVVAGTVHYDEFFLPGMELFLRREPGNPHDKFAIALKTSDDNLVGYVPSSTAQWLAHVMDKEQVSVSARITGTGTKNFFAVAVYLTDKGREILYPLSNPSPTRDLHNLLLDAVLDHRKRHAVTCEPNDDDRFPETKLLRAILRGYVKHGYAIGASSLIPT